MNSSIHYRTLLGSLILVSVVACTVSETSSSHSYHFDAPAAKWEESLPLGNGRMGAMPDGGTDRETIILNEISMWSGSRQNTDNPLAVESLPEIRSLLFQRRNDEAQELMYKTFTCAGTGSYSGYSQPYGSYQLFGRMHLDFGHTDFSGYRRELSLDEATASVRYTSNGVNYRRETIVSYPDDVIAIHLTSDRKDALEFALSLDRISADGKLSPAVDITVDGEDLVMSGRLPSGTENGGPADGTRYIGRVRILLPHGGRLQAEESSLKVTGAQEATVLVALKTDYFQDDYQEIAKVLLDKASGLSWEKLLKRHKESFGALFKRVNLDFGHDAGREALPMDKRLEAFAESPRDPSLIALYYQFGRYLLISSTRPGYLPPNLQGLWANTIDTPWNGDYHLNINLQMNLWPAESGNLGELHMPLIEWVKKQVPSGQNTARVFYNSRGWVTHVLGNVWEFTAPSESPTWGATNTSAAWLCQHLYRHYQYNPDEEYLRDVYPVMKEAALFFVDMLVEDPNSHYLVTAPTTSPENGYKFANGTRRATVSAGSTMDNQIIRELFTNTIEASGILNIDSEFRDILVKTRDRLMPTTIAEDGRIMEWLEPFEEVEIEHRHVSHLFGLYPGDEISIARTPELAEAARRSLEVRGDQSTGWSMAWKINFWARLHDGDHAYKLITDLLNPTDRGMNHRNGGGSYPNLFCAHPPFQIDGNFGGAAGIAEMLVQSHEGRIELLPALPSSLPDGSLSGIRVRGGAEISMIWKEGRVTSVSLHALHDGVFDIKNYSDGPVKLKKGETWKWEQTNAAAAICSCIPKETALTVMSYNIRMGVANDGDNSWDIRKPATAEMLDTLNPDVFGVQEAFDFQLAYIQETCPRYKAVGVGRDDGSEEGEHMSVIFNTEKIELVDWGTYWLSETPDVPSYGWDAACRRTATWTKLRVKASGKEFFFVNTHLDHVGVVARKEGLAMIVERIGAMNPDGIPMILTGDFNITPDNEGLVDLVKIMKNSRYEAVTSDTKPSYNGWGTAGEEIDYIWYAGFDGCPVFRVVDEPYAGKPFISDHYPVTAKLEW